MIKHNNILSDSTLGTWRKHPQCKMHNKHESGSTDLALLVYAGFHASSLCHLQEVATELQEWYNILSTSEQTRK